MNAKRLVAVGLAMLSLGTLAAQGAEQWEAVVAPDNSFSGLWAKDDKPVMALDVVGWGGTKFSEYSGAPESHGKAAGGVLKISAPWTISGAKVTLGCTVQKTGQRTVAYRYEFDAPQDLPVTELTTELAVKQGTAGKILLTRASGRERNLDIPQHKQPDVTDVANLTFQLQGAGDVVVTLDPPCGLHPENDRTRVKLAQGVLKAGKSVVTMTITFPGPVEFSGAAEIQNKYVVTLAGPTWFAFQGSNDLQAGALGFADWLDKPAGKHGGVRMQGSRFVFEDGTPVKFWGTNLCYGWECAPTKANAELAAARFAKWGVNAVRLHKPCGPGDVGDPVDGTKFVPAALDRMEYFAAQLKKHGVYFGMSHTYNYMIRPGNKGRYLAYEEIQSQLGGNTSGLINYAPDVQDLLIEMVVNLLHHKNPHTGLTWAREPALAYIELHNEDDIFWFSSPAFMGKCPTYTKDVLRRWAQWLQAKYGSREALARAWGNALHANETLEAKNIAFQGNPWYMGPGLPGTGGARTRMLDNAAFMHDLQDQFYSKFIRAIRTAGYEGPLCGSSWQAPAMLPHYYNLHSDYEVGWIDRHDYFSGGAEATMLSQPGSGYLSAGLQQVADRPFGISEWVHVFPTIYNAEGPAIFAVYGMGLQGWSSSYEFQSISDRGTAWNPVVNASSWAWDVDVPTQIGQFPILARMIARGDVRQSPVISTRRVSREDLPAGKFDFSDTINQQGDIKEFTGSTPAEALAAGRVVVEFTKDRQPSTFPDMKTYKSGKVITSATGQLRWDYTDRGFFTVNTFGSKAVVGFAQDKEQTLGDVKMTLQCPYASVFLTAAGKGETLANAKTALLSAMARNCNRGFKVSAFDNAMLQSGGAPIMLEPVKATIAIAGRRIAAVNLLDHDGKRTPRTLATADGTFTIDGTRDQTPYYEIVFQ
jgi:hypothetical protein